MRFSAVYSNFFLVSSIRASTSSRPSALSPPTPIFGRSCLAVCRCLTPSSLRACSQYLDEFPSNPFQDPFPPLAIGIPFPVAAFDHNPFLSVAANLIGIVVILAYMIPVPHPSHPLVHGMCMCMCACCTAES